MMDYEQRLNDNQRKRFAFMLKQKRKDKKLSHSQLLTVVTMQLSFISDFINFSERMRNEK